MKKACWLLPIILLLIVPAWILTSHPAKPGSFAWEFRTNIWFFRQGIWDVGLQANANDPEYAGWVVSISGDYDISFITNQVQILSLELSGSNLVDLSPLATQKSIRELVVNNCPVYDISPITNLYQLFFLDLSGTSISNVNALANLNMLSHLDISNTQVADISPLAELHNLRFLSASHSCVTNLLPLAKLHSLTDLDIDGIPCRDFAGIPFKNLRFLKLTAQGVKPWANVQTLHDSFNGCLFFAFYPHPIIGEGYSFHSKEYAFKHFDEINGTDNIILEPPQEPNVPFILSPVEPSVKP
jgi:hypothetical protein